MARDKMAVARLSGVRCPLLMLKEWLSCGQVWDAERWIYGVTTTYTWDWRGLMTQRQKTGETTVSFTYDGDGLRVARTPSGEASTRFLLDDASVVEEITGQNTVSYVLGLGLSIIGSIDTNGMMEVYHGDAHGSVRAISDGDQAVVGVAVQDAYGEDVMILGGAPSYAYGGHYCYYTDPTGLLYLSTRYYSPETARFLSRDSLGYAGGMNLYEYVGGNPVTRVDPYGLDWIDDSSNFFAGWGDSLTFGGTGVIRDWIGVDDVVDQGSGWYKGGRVVGVVHGIALSGPRGPLFRMGIRGVQGPGIFNGGLPVIGRIIRVGYTWDDRLRFGFHGGVPRTAGHWHSIGEIPTTIPVPEGVRNACRIVGI